MRLMLTTKAGAVDITQLVTEVTLSGDYQQCARTLSFGLISHAQDKNVPVVDCALGSGVTLSFENLTLFDGYVFGRDKATDDDVIELTCFDRGIYLKRNKASYSVKGMAPAAMVARICADFGITAGEVASPAVSVTRKFLGVTLFDIISTMYTIASEKTGAKYLIRFDGAKLCVVERREDAASVALDGSSNLIRAATSESVESMVNQVVIYNKNDVQIKTLQHAENISLYGRMQEYMKQGGEDVTAKAQKLLDDNGVSQKITVDNLGDVRCITGNTVTLQEAYTGLTGLFFIDSDTHTWKNGQYYNRLVLNYRKMMHEASAGQEDK